MNRFFDQQSPYRRLYSTTTTPSSDIILPGGNKDHGCLSTAKMAVGKGGATRRRENSDKKAMARRKTVVRVEGERIKDNFDVTLMYNMNEFLDILVVFCVWNICQIYEISRCSRIDKEKRISRIEENQFFDMNRSKCESMPIIEILSTC